MKNKILLPMVACLLAVLGAFASNFDASSPTTYWIKNSGCVTTTNPITTPANGAGCQEEGDVVCKIDIGGTDFPAHVSQAACLASTPLRYNSNK